MLKSMTGYGRGGAKNSHYAIQVELKSVNHRYLDLFIRLPRQYNLLEETLRSVVQGRIARGRVEVTVNVEDFGQVEQNVMINTVLLQGYLQALTNIQSVLKSDEQITLSHVLALPDLLETQEVSPDWVSLEEVFKQALELALVDLEKMRQAEGKRLKTDMLTKTALLESLIQEIQSVAPRVIIDYRQRLGERLADLLEGTSIPEERFLAEVALFADRCSIDEELVRLTSHLEQFKDALASAESVGRKLDFLLIEMNREANTIGSKANSVQIASLVVEIKSELEKIREQVQNIQ